MTRSWTLPAIPDDVRQVTDGTRTYDRDRRNPGRWWQLDGNGRRIPASLSLGSLLSIAPQIWEVQP